jgi:hypothetical protein
MWFQSASLFQPSGARGDEYQKAMGLYDVAVGKVGVLT